MKRIIQAYLVICLLSLTPIFAIDGGVEAKINRISIVPGDMSTRLVLDSSAPLSIVRSFYSEEAPNTIVIDCEAVETIPIPKDLAKKSSLVENIVIERNGSITHRMYLSLTDQVPYRISSEERKTVIEMNHVRDHMKHATLDPNFKKAVESQKFNPSYLKNISVSKGKESATVSLKLTGKAQPRIFALNDPLRLVVDLYNTLHNIPHENKPVNHSGIKNIRTSQFKLADPYTITRIVLDLEEASCYSIEEYGSGLSVSIFGSPTAAASIPAETATPPVEETREAMSEPPVETPPAQPETDAAAKQQDPPPLQSKTLVEQETVYSGQLVTMRFKDADLRDVVLTLAEIGNLNVVFNRQVRGTVTVSLVDIPWDQALDLILQENQMGRTIEGNVLRIAPIKVLTQERRDQRQLTESKELAGPVEVKTFELSYARAKDVQDLLKGRISERGEILVDERTNTLIISEVRDKMQVLERLIMVFDQPTPQVSIEARIVEANSNFVRNLGIQWGWKGISDPFYGNQTSLQFPNKLVADGALIPQGIATRGIGGPLGGYAINLPAPSFSTAVGFSIANVLDTFRIDMALSALETTGEGRVISSPTITTQNNQEAEILQGRQIPVQTTANFTVTTRFQNAALELRATPRITAEGTIVMEIEIRNNKADFANLVNGIPPIIMQSARATVMVPDGGTAAIGGIHQTEESITRNNVPFLHKIPILGALFKSSAKTMQNRELLIFITPRIIK